jgi:endoglucanase
MNLSGFDRIIGPIRGTNYPAYADALLDWYRAKSVTSVRVMFTWEAVQSVLGGPIPSADPGYADYWTDLIGVVTRLLARDIYVILSPWQFNPASVDTDIVYDAAPFGDGHFADFWSRFAAAINGVTAHDGRVAFDLINEPHTHAESGKPGDIGISVTAWFLCAQAAIDAIRAVGATNTIFVPGMAYSAASSFTTNGSAAGWLALVDPLANIAVSVHCYSGLRSLRRASLRRACSAVVSWAGAAGVKVHIGEIAIDAGGNGRPSFCSSFARAARQWADWNAFCLENRDVLVGWNWWGNSAAGWWNEGDSCDAVSGFHWGLTLDDGATQTVYMDLIGPSLREGRGG